MGGRGVPPACKSTMNSRRSQELFSLFLTKFFEKKTLTRNDFPDNLFVMKTENMIATLDNISLRNLGRARSLAIAARACVTCGKRADLFRDSLSVKEYHISGMCQICQDKVFVEAE